MPADHRLPRPIDAKRQRAQANHDSMVDAATELFASIGYAGTTMEAVAARVGMSVQSVYFAFHTKANLLRTALDRATPPPAARLTETDPDLALRMLVDEACRVLAATGSLALAAAAAAPGDPAAEEVNAHILAGRSQDAAQLVQQLKSRRPLAPGVTVRRTSDVVYALLSPQLHAVLVRDRGWSATRYAAWSADGIGRALWG